MRRIILVVAIIFTIVALVFALLPLDTIAFLPIGLAIVSSLLLLKNSENKQKQLPKILVLVTVISSAFVLGKTLLIKDEVVQDTKFEQQKIETKQEAKQELETLEKDLE